MLVEVNPLPDSLNLKTEATRVGRSGAEAVVFTGFAAQTGVAASQLRQLRFEGAFLSVLMYPTAISTANGALEGAVYADYAPPELGFQARFQEKFGEKPGTSADKGYDAVRILALAITIAGSQDVSAVRDALARTVNYNGASGRITFSPKRGVVAEPRLFQVLGGKMGIPDQW